jgi:lysophospholipase L1-like esterase
MKIENGSKLLFIGDSITDCGRARPVGEGLHWNNLGNGYVSIVQAQILTKYPESRIRVINMGVGGDTVRHLKARWQTDVLDLKPDWLSIMIGINDVWRQFDNPLIPECHVYLDEYVSTLNQLIEETKPTLKGLVLMSPFIIEDNKNDAMRKKMDEYRFAMKEIAQKHNAIFVDVQEEFDRFLKHYHSYALALDRIHPNLTGHMIIANAFLKAIEF